VLLALRYANPLNVVYFIGIYQSDTFTYQGPPPDDLRWVWEYAGPEENEPRDRLLIEENLGPYERKLLLLNKGKQGSQPSTPLSGAK
jgi:hypothetical protein